jgi:anthranilate phosphoribosyltransferase
LLQEPKHDGKLADLWVSALEGAALKQTEMAGAFSELLASKDTADVQKIKKAAFLAASAMKNFAVEELERAAPLLLFDLCLCNVG